ncbi:MAG: hypothetical protein HOH33_07550 [Verrucomicrobia bacterium]|nr:hypothetical protein [Verrucomicrobiota bacterium]
MKANTKYRAPVSTVMPAQISNVFKDSNISKIARFFPTTPAVGINNESIVTKAFSKLIAKIRTHWYLVTHEFPEDRNFGNHATALAWTQS